MADLSKAISLSLLVNVDPNFILDEIRGLPPTLRGLLTLAVLAILAILLLALIVY
jgi:hypothetical protein